MLTLIVFLPVQLLWYTVVTVPDFVFGGLLVELTHTHAKVRIGCIYSHITVSHLSVPFCSVGKVCTPSEIYIFIVCL